MQLPKKHTPSKVDAKDPRSTKPTVGKEIQQGPAIAETGATNAKDMGKVMKAVMAGLVGKTVDGKKVSESVKAKLG